MAKKLIYHGTIYRFDTPSLYKCKDRKDFGKGFYLAEDLEHAKSIARNNYAVRHVGSKYIYSYKIDIEEMRKSGIKIHEFKSPSYEWIDYVIKSRSLVKTEEFDVIIGPTADKSAQVIIEKFYNRWGLEAENIEKDRLLKELNATYYGKQYCFKTQRSINYLNMHFCERRVII